MKIGIIGAGSVAKAFARQLLRGGHEVVLSNSRGPDSLFDVVAALGEGATSDTVSHVATLPVVVLAVPWLKVDEAIQGLPNWQDTVVIDATNHFTTPPRLADLEGNSSSEIVASKLPGARVVKALNTLLAEHLHSGPAESGGRRIVFVSGDHLDAKRQILTLIDELGFCSIDLGSLAVGGRIQQAGGPLAGLDVVRMS